MAGNVPGLPGAQAVASTATIGYLGFLIGPLVLGTLGDLVSIRLSIATIGLTVLLVQSFAHMLRPTPAPANREDFLQAPDTVTVDTPLAHSLNRRFTH